MLSPQYYLKNTSNQTSLIERPKHEIDDDQISIFSDFQNDHGSNLKLESDSIFGPLPLNLPALSPSTILNNQPQKIEEERKSPAHVDIFNDDSPKDATIR